ncbi:hypothetical protein E3P99_01970 [Wallemia hederae]|uniref:Mob1/phocein n=1 Tax=Wallemia hederae TaxID=1540922 RepID=A0A4T0FMS3_9BASI|nr:hypothetical protein E3P99_01970 [Wallemia hederae]
MAQLGNKKSNNSLRASNRIQSPSAVATPTTAQAVVTKSGSGGDMQRKKSHEILKSHQKRFNMSARDRGSGARLNTDQNTPESVQHGVHEQDREDENENGGARKRIRIRRGMRRHSFQNAQCSTSSTHDSPFQLQEHLNYLLRNRHPVDAQVKLPQTAHSDSNTTWLWIYEHLRCLARDLNTPWMTLLQDECACPEMKANDATFVCVSHCAHRKSKCSAVDYSTHNLNSVADDLNDVSLAGSVDTQKSVLRRLTRIVAHVYAHHRDVFLVCEAETGVARRIAKLSKEYGILPQYIIIWDDSDDDKETLDHADGFNTRRTPSTPRQLIDVGPVSASEDSDSDEYNSDED